MSTVTAFLLDPRPSLRRPEDALPRSSIGTAPMLWSNADGAPHDGSDAMAILDEIARVGYEGTQLGNGFPLPSESAAIGRRVLASALRRLGAVDLADSLGSPGSSGAPGASGAPA
jgi:hypothetical protein